MHTEKAKKKKEKNLKANTELRKCEYTKNIDVKGKKNNNYPIKKKKIVNHSS